MKRSVFCFIAGGQSQAPQILGHRELHRAGGIVLSAEGDDDPPEPLEVKAPLSRDRRWLALQYHCWMQNGIR